MPAFKPSPPPRRGHPRTTWPRRRELLRQSGREGGKGNHRESRSPRSLSRSKEHVIGLISIYRLLQQKDSFSAVDYELFSLLAAHAATAIFSSKLYSQSERKLNTIQSFLDLLTTTS
jgi:hypothetical protein